MAQFAATDTVDLYLDDPALEALQLKDTSTLRAQYTLHLYPQTDVLFEIFLGADITLTPGASLTVKPDAVDLAAWREGNPSSNPLGDASALTVGVYGSLAVNGALSFGQYITVNAENGKIIGNSAFNMAADTRLLDNDSQQFDFDVQGSVKNGNTHTFGSVGNGQTYNLQDGSTQPDTP